MEAEMETVQMNATTYPPVGWFSRAEAWLDSKGKGAWIALMVLGFVVFWPIGLAILFYMIWSKGMFRKKSAKSTMSSSGNAAFDSYRTDTLRRLEDEQAEFEAFLVRLRAAKDKAEFDQFIGERTAKDSAAS